MTLREPSWLQGGVLITDDIVERLGQEALSASPGEACGILLGDRTTKTIREIMPAGNIAEAGGGSRRFYRIDPMEVYRLERRAESGKYEIVGFYHSHVEAAAVPSEEDERNMIPGMIYMIVPVYGGLAGFGRAYRKDSAGGPVTEIVVGLKGRG